MGLLIVGVSVPSTVAPFALALARMAAVADGRFDDLPAWMVLTGASETASRLRNDPDAVRVGTSRLSDDDKPGLAVNA